MAAVQVAIIGLTLPIEYYRQFYRLRRLWDEGNADKNLLIRDFGMWTDNLTAWLLDQTKNHGTRFEIIGPVGLSFKLGLSDDPDGADAHWTDKIIQELSDKAGLSDLWDKWNNGL